MLEVTQYFCKTVQIDENKLFKDICDNIFKKLDNPIIKDFINEITLDLDKYLEPYFIPYSFDDIDNQSLYTNSDICLDTVHNITTYISNKYRMNDLLKDFYNNLK